MSEHVLVVEYDGDAIRAEVRCQAPEGANCRLDADCSCESWTVQRCGDGTAYHRADTYGGAEVLHWMHDAGECNACTWINSDPEECGPARAFTLAEVPVSVVWDPEDVRWERANKGGGDN